MFVNISSRSLLIKVLFTGVVIKRLIKLIKNTLFITLGNKKFERKHCPSRYFFSKSIFLLSKLNLEENVNSYSYNEAERNSFFSYLNTFVFSIER